MIQLFMTRKQEQTTDGFEWTSDSAAAIDSFLLFGFAGFFEDVTEMQLQFPVGDTYKFDLSISNDLDGTGEPFATVPVRRGLSRQAACILPCTKTGVDER